MSKRPGSESLNMTCSNCKKTNSVLLEGIFRGVYSANVNLMFFVGLLDLDPLRIVCET